MCRRSEQGCGGYVRIPIHARILVQPSGTLTDHLIKPSGNNIGHGIESLLFTNVKPSLAIINTERILNFLVESRFDCRSPPAVMLDGDLWHSEIVSNLNVPVLG